MGTDLTNPMGIHEILIRFSLDLMGTDLTNPMVSIRF